MPNHTHNFVEIGTNTGCSKEQLALAELKTKLSIENKEFDFDAMIPSPKWENIPNEDGELPTLDKDGPFETLRWKDGKQDDRWYYWRIDNWGTKWNSYDLYIDTNSNNELVVEFLTAWSPPREIFIALRDYCNKNNLALGWEYQQEEDGYEETYQLDQEC